MTLAVGDNVIVRFSSSYNLYKLATVTRLTSKLVHVTGLVYDVTGPRVYRRQFQRSNVAPCSPELWEQIMSLMAEYRELVGEKRRELRRLFEEHTDD